MFIYPNTVNGKRVVAYSLHDKSQTKTEMHAFSVFHTAWLTNRANSLLVLFTYGRSTELRYTEGLTFRLHYI